MWTLKDGEAYVYHKGRWLHECYLDFIISYEEEKNYGNP